MIAGTTQRFRAQGCNHDLVIEVPPMPKPLFSIGDKVTAKAFTDCFGKHHPAVNGMTVVGVEKIDGYAPHVRIRAEKADGPVKIFESSQRFFEPA